IQEPRRKNILIDYESLQRLIGAGFYDQLWSSHKGWIEEYLRDGAKNRQDEWTGSIAVGSRSFLKGIGIPAVIANRLDPLKAIT
ncbi:MAG: hypothetical protein Q8M56_12035, partial [Desulfobacterales bacterium]|nr:hypothetical protein [Desulfobacterales bacterium]